MSPPPVDGMKLLPEESLAITKKTLKVPMASALPKKADEQPQRAVLVRKSLRDETNVNRYRREEANTVEESLAIPRKTTYVWTPLPEQPERGSLARKSPHPQDETDVNQWVREDANAKRKKTIDSKGVELEEHERDVMLRELRRDEKTSCDMRELKVKELATAKTAVVKVPKVEKRLSELRAERAVWVRERTNLERRLQEYRADVASLTVTRDEELKLSDSLLRTMIKFRAELDLIVERQALRRPQISESPGCSFATGDSDSVNSGFDF